MLQCACVAKEIVALSSFEKHNGEVKSKGFVSFCNVCSILALIRATSRIWAGKRLFYPTTNSIAFCFTVSVIRTSFRHMNRKYRQGSMNTKIHNSACSRRSISLKFIRISYIDVHTHITASSNVAFWLTHRFLHYFNGSFRKWHECFLRTLVRSFAC